MTTKVIIEPGVCRLTCSVTAEFTGKEVTIEVETACPSVSGMIDTLGPSFDPYTVCFQKPGDGPLYEYARENFVGHAACPTIAGITKAIEAEASLALPADASIRFA